VLTEIWGNVGLYHPVPSAERLRWDDVLVEAVRRLDSVHGDREFVDLLNRVVFAPLHDPLMYATTRADNDSAYTFLPALQTRSLAPGVVYVSAVDRAYWQRHPTSTVFQPRDFVTPLRKIIDSIAAGRELKRLVIDLRSSSAAAYRPGLPATWLGMWTRQTIRTARQISVLRTTAEGMGQVQWVLSPSDSLDSDGPTISIPTVFIVNRTSYAAAEPALDAVRSSRPDVAVVFEQGGPIPNLGYNAFQVFYPDSVLLPHNHTIRLSADGALGTVVDTTIHPGLPLEEFDRISARALALRGGRPARAPFGFDDATVTNDTVSAAPLTREQRVAGLMKIWFSVARFYAYPDDITGDWRRLPAEWLPRVEGAGDDRAYYRLLGQISASLNDTHSDVAHPLSFAPTGFVPPLYLAYVQDRVAVVRVDSADASLGVAPGDEVIGIDGQDINALESSLYRYWSISKRVHRSPMRAFLIGPKNSSMTLRIRTARGSRNLVLPRSRPFFSVYGQMFPDHPLFAVLPGNIGYVNLAWMDTKQKFDSTMTALAGTRGMILDSRSIAAGEAEFSWHRFIADAHQWMARVETVSSQHDDYSPSVGFGMSQAWDVPSVSAGQP
jgi:hypothetical protein